MAMPRCCAICSALTKFTDSARCGVSIPLSAATERIFVSRSSTPHSSIAARVTGPLTICAAKRPSFSARLIERRGVGVGQPFERQVDRGDEDRAAQRVDDHLRGLHGHAVLRLDRVRADVRREDDVLRVEQRVVFCRRLVDVDVDGRAGDLAAVERVGERLSRRRCRRARC